MPDKNKIFSNLMIATDLDGTLITPAYKIPEPNFKAVDDFIKGGGLFTIATGRSIESARQYAKAIKVNAPIIVMNGAIIYDYSKEKIIWDYPLDKAARQYTQAVMDKFPDVGIEIYSGNQLYIMRQNHVTYIHAQNEAIDPIEVNSFDDIPPTWHKVLFAGNHEELEPVADFCLGNLTEKAEYVFTAPVYYEMMPVGINKGATLKVLAKLLNINIENTIAIGDYYNDIQLLSAAGIGALSGSSPKELWKHADIVLCPCEEGVAKDLVNRLTKLLKGNKSNSKNCLEDIRRI